MITAKTYYVGGRGMVYRLDNLDVPFIDVHVNTNSTMLDVETDTVDGNKVYVVGNVSDVDILQNQYGIYVSSDGGSTWDIPTGNYQSVAIENHRWNEVSVVDNDNIFICGDSGYVCKSTDGGHSFRLCTQAPMLPPQYNSLDKLLRCLSIHFITALKGVVGLQNNIIRTVNGGVTWEICNNGNGIENFITGPVGGIFGIHIDSSFNTVIAVSSTLIIRSNIVWDNWESKYTFGQRGGLHLTWEDDLRLWGTGNNNEIVQTIDGGYTWIIKRAYDINNSSPVRAAHFYYLDNGFTGVNLLFSASNNGGTNSIAPLQNVEKPIYAIWTKYKSDCYQITPCDGGEAIIVNNDLSDEFAAEQVIKICPEVLPIGVHPSYLPNGTYKYYRMHDCCGRFDDVYGVTINYPQTLSVIYLNSIGHTCWELTYLGVIAPSTEVYIITPILNYKECQQCQEQHPCLPPQIVDECTCFTIDEAPTCEGNIPITITETYDGCPYCNPSCYKLTNCQDSNDYVVTQQDFSDYIDDIVTLEDCPDKCWIVSLLPDCIGQNPVIISTVVESFDDCVTCLPVVPPIPIPPLNIRSVKPGYNTPSCDPEYTERVNCTFSNIIYKNMLELRYGITTCCSEELTKWDIKKQLLDLKALYDEDLCRAELCCPPCGVRAYIYIR